MKPDWKDAPKWANWLAQHGDGSWWWFEERPKADTMFRIWTTRYQCNNEFAFVPDEKQYIPTWMHTRERRPKS